MAPVKEPNVFLPRSHVDAYWELVRRSLSEIFNKSPSEADDYQQEIENLPLLQQDFFYNGEALYVAAALADEDPTEKQHAHYQRLQAKIYRLSEREA